jgi:hypothetical protein
MFEQICDQYLDWLDELEAELRLEQIAADIKQGFFDDDEENETDPPF